MSTPISAHFSLDEFSCRDGSPYPVNNVDDEDPKKRTWFETRLAPLVNTLEVLREAAGNLPLHINSGYRTIAYDQKLYDADAGRGNVAKPQGSQHPKGRAVDVTHATLAPKELHQLVLKLQADGKLPYLGGLGLYPSFIHLDVRPKISNRIAMWGGTRLSNVA
jgi:uncharacterized protein YcbK (DUF882 family)